MTIKYVRFIRIRMRFEIYFRINSKNRKSSHYFERKVQSFTKNSLFDIIFVRLLSNYKTKHDILTFNITPVYIVSQLGYIILQWCIIKFYTYFFYLKVNHTLNLFFHHPTSLWVEALLFIILQKEKRHEQENFNRPKSKRLCSSVECKTENKKLVSLNDDLTVIT